MSLNVCVGKPVQYFIECDRNNAVPALVFRDDGEGMLVLVVFQPYPQTCMSVRHVSDPMLEKNENITHYGCWDFLPEDKRAGLDALPIGTDPVGKPPGSTTSEQPEEKKPLPEPKRK